MTRKELLKTVDQYKALATDLLATQNPYAAIVGACSGIATDPCYTHHERGQRIWAFFQALEEVNQ